MGNGDFGMVTEHLDHVSGLVISRLRVQQQDREDIRHECFLVGVTCLRTFREERGSKFQAYFYVAAIRHARRYMDKQMRVLSDGAVDPDTIADDMDMGENEGQDDTPERVGLEVRLRTWAKGIRLTRKQCVVLEELEKGGTMTEVARRLGAERRELRRMIVRIQDRAKAVA